MLAMRYNPRIMSGNLKKKTAENCLCDYLRSYFVGFAGHSFWD
jgi:hypothetical protein